MKIRHSLIGLSAALLVAGASAVHAQTVIIATNPQGSIQYASGAAVAKVLVAHTDVKARIQPSGGSSTYIPMLNRGEVQFGFSNGLEAMFAHEGKGTFEGRKNPNLRLVGMVFPLYLSLIVPADAPAKTVRDIKGMSIGAGFTSQTIMQYVQSALLANGDLSHSDMKTAPVSGANDATLQQAQGRFDVSTCPPGGGVCARAHAALSSHGGVRFLSLEDGPTALARMKKHLPSAWIAELAPAKNLVGVVGNTKVMAYPYYLIASKDTPGDLVYKVAKALHGNKPDLAKAFAVMNRFDPKDMAHPHSVPYHPAATRFYKEIGIWKE